MKTFFKEKTCRDAAYLKWIRSRPCLVCGKIPAGESHHSETGGIELVGSDYSALPICSADHRDIHQHHSKRGTWSKEELVEIIASLRAEYEKNSNPCARTN